MLYMTKLATVICNKFVCRAYARFKSECFDLKVNTVVLVNMIMATRQTCLYLGVKNPNLILCYVKYVKLILYFAHL